MTGHGWTWRLTAMLGSGSRLLPHFELARKEAVPSWILTLRQASSNTLALLHTGDGFSYNHPGALSLSRVSSLFMASTHSILTCVLCVYRCHTQGGELHSLWREKSEHFWLIQTEQLFWQHNNIRNDCMFLPSCWTQFLIKQACPRAAHNMAADFPQSEWARKQECVLKIEVTLFCNLTSETFHPLCHWVQQHSGKRAICTRVNTKGQGSLGATAEIAHQRVRALDQWWEYRKTWTNRLLANLWGYVLWKAHQLTVCNAQEMGENLRP